LAEASVFETELKQQSYRSGEKVAREEALLLVRKGTLELQVETPSGPLRFGTIGTGGLLGEIGLFVSDPVHVQAQAESDADCLVADLRPLKSSFRYSRTGAVKFMGIFARSLSDKIRSANDMLQKAPPSSEPPTSGAFRPSQLDALDLKRLKSLTAARSYAEEDVLFREGDAGEELFVIEQGEVEILKKKDSGEPITLAALGPGDFFGEMAFVDAKPRSAEAVARSPLHVHVLPAGSLDRVIEYNVGTALYLSSVICKIMARRLNATLRRVATL
jgi:CRP-like cAMP-binding protein